MSRSLCGRTRQAGDRRVAGLRGELQAHWGNAPMCLERGNAGSRIKGFEKYIMNAIKAQNNRYFCRRNKFDCIMALLDLQDEKTVGQIWQKGLVFYC